MNELDWGYNVNRHMEAARRSVAADDPDYSALIRAKLTASYEGRKIDGVEGIHIIREHRDEARAVIAAMVEKSLPEIPDDPKRMILELALKAEELQMCRASADPFAHQLKLETMCEELTNAVLFLLCQQLVQPRPSSKEGQP